jgi:NADH-quinone oxidoreductase subunit L
MGGMRAYMPVTWILMWGATLAIAGVPPFSGFFSKDEILGTLFMRAGHSTLADASWLGIPGSAVLYICYALGLAAALMTAVYMTRMMIYTFHGPNRTGDEERKHLHEAPWIMTGPLVVLGIFAVFGGWFNLPELIPIGPVGVLEHWLEPVVGAGQAHIAVTTETKLTLALAATVAALVGIAVASLVYLRRRVRAVEPAVLAHAWYYDTAITRFVGGPGTKGFEAVAWFDRNVVDGAVNGVATLVRNSGRRLRTVQSGFVRSYALGMSAGVVVVLGYFLTRLFV